MYTCHLQEALGITKKSVVRTPDKEFIFHSIFITRMIVPLPPPLWPQFLPANQLAISRQGLVLFSSEKGMFSKKYLKEERHVDVDLENRSSRQKRVKHLYIGSHAYT